MTMNADDRAILETAKTTLFRLSAELALSTGKHPDDKKRIERMRRISSSMALRVDEHLRDF